MNKKMFEDIVIFFVSEPGAMGPNDMTFYKKSGEYFTIDYNSDKTPYSELREAFPLLKECYWNGPARTEKEQLGTVVIGASYADGETHVAPGWKHIYLDFGNHLAVREELYEIVLDMLGEYDNCKITFGWTEILKQKGLADKLAELLK